MTGDRVVRSTASPERPTFLELLVDLVYVFALTRISQRLVSDINSEHRLPFANAGATLLLLLALWVTWSTTVWSTSWLDPDVPVIRTVLLITMIGSMVMAVTVPHGFTDRALAFAVAHVGTQIVRTLYYGIVTRRTPQGQSAVRALLWCGLYGPIWIIGGLIVQEPLRGALWTGAVLLEYIGWAWGLPVPRLGRDRLAAQPIVAGHLAERYQQFLLIALGEMIFTIGAAFSGDPFRSAQTAGFAAGLAGAVLLWQIYFHRAGRLLAEAINDARNPSWLGFAAAYTHLVMITGIVVTGVGYELTVSEPLGGPAPMWLLAILGGPSLFLIGRALLEFQVFGRISRSRPAGLAALGALTPVLLYVPPLAASGAATGVLLGVAALDLCRDRGREADHNVSPR